MEHINDRKSTTNNYIIYYTIKLSNIGKAQDVGYTMEWMEDVQYWGVTIASSTTTCMWWDHHIKTIITSNLINFTLEVGHYFCALDGDSIFFDIVTLRGYTCNHPREQGNWVTYTPTRGRILQH